MSSDLRLLSDLRKVEQAEWDELVGQHQAWLKGEQETWKGRLRLTNVDISDIQAEGQDLRRINLIRSKAHFTLWSKADLTGASIHECDLSFAHMDHATLREADLFKSHLRDADLDGADLFGAQLAYANLANATLEGANLSASGLQYTLLQNAVLTNARLWSASIQSAQFTGALLQGADTHLIGHDQRGFLFYLQNLPAEGDSLETTVLAAGCRRFYNAEDALDHWQRHNHAGVNPALYLDIRSLVERARIVAGFRNWNWR